ncbi:AMP-dependent synthetase [Pseudonocardia sp. EC080610-09]|uniref:class I adenylate-forming enzyme family protein n=1 Tax=unclassified Pseudonocardia TaxID=2619320 RepID=UPI0006CB1511|nr:MULTISPECIES: class I adenylate-forming enzyme family protein [unclassified Pseudonocardia]ALE73513.1 AMP-dependent synthetase [Pseudonocardia sp. EC080625-04]ALL76960.1 AMP-dependent synthetase [Pseudonocardia sp. EC080610-09]ALL83991.1 AMP-dependent synthetase [Pseudonocardia sp. EC080619-01]
MSTDVTGDLTLVALMERWAAQRPDAPALVHHGGTVTWGRLGDDVTDLRGRLAAAGAVDGARVVLALPNCPLVVAAWVAVPANGAVVAAVDPESGAAVLARTLSTIAPVLVVGTEDNAGGIQQALQRIGSDARVVATTAAEREGTRLDRLGPTTAPPEATAADVAALLPTSGTSAAPKLVELTHRNLVAGADRMARNSGFLAADRHYLCTPFFHAVAQSYVCPPPFVTGGSIAIVAGFSASRWFDDARTLGVTVSCMVAPPLRMALHRAVERGGAVDPGPLRAIHYGMTLSAADWKDWDRLLPQVHMRQIYGQTESVNGVIGAGPWDTDDRATLGRPYLGIDGLRLVGPDGADVPDGEPGELWVRGVPGATVMRGYRDAPEATAATLVDGAWLRTGDQLVRHPGGRYEFRGRAMHIIRRGGENLSAYALETDLRSCPHISDVCITAEPDEIRDNLVVAHVIPLAGFDERVFLDWCREHAGRQGVPDRVRLHTGFPRTPSGRVIVRELGSG